MKYRKKPIVVEAVLLENTYRSIAEAFKFVFGIDIHTGDSIEDGIVTGVRINDGIDIKTLEGVMHANFEDYIIKGVNGEFYPCKPDIFIKTYEKEN